VITSLNFTADEHTHTQCYAGAIINHSQFQKQNTKSCCATDTKQN